MEKVGKHPDDLPLVGWVEGNRMIVGYMKTESCIGRGAIQSRHKAELGLLGLGGGEEENNQGQKKNELAKSTLERVEHCFWKGLMIQSRKCYKCWGGGGILQSNILQI